MIERLGVFDRKPMSSWLWVETFVITLLALGLGYLAHAGDPLFIEGEFQWIWFAPVLLALRYGVLAGIASAATLAAGWYVAQDVGAPSPAEFPKVFFLGGLLLTLACGEYSASWRARIRRLEEINVYSGERLQSLTRAHYLLNLSHGRLEQNLIFKPLTLRDAMLQLRPALAAAAEDAQGNSGAQAFLNILAQLCQLETASLYLTAPGAAPKLAARIGAAQALDTDDPLIKCAEEKRTLSHVQQGAMDASRYLAVAPLVSSNGVLLGLLTVERMAFLALSHDIMQVMNALAGYFADSIALSDGAAEVLAAHPDCPPEFANELVKVVRMQHEARIPSSLVALTFNGHPQTPQIVQRLGAVGRGADVQWQKQSPEGKVVMLNLMPLASDVAVSGYLVRLEAWLQREFGLSFTDADIRHREISFAAGDAATLLKSAC